MTLMTYNSRPKPRLPSTESKRAAWSVPRSAAPKPGHREQEDRHAAHRHAEVLRRGAILTHCVGPVALRSPQQKDGRDDDQQDEPQQRHAQATQVRAGDEVRPPRIEVELGRARPGRGRSACCGSTSIVPMVTMNECSRVVTTSTPLISPMDTPHSSATGSRPRTNTPSASRTGRRNRRSRRSHRRTGRSSR